MVYFFKFRNSLGESIFRTCGPKSLKNEHFVFPLSFFFFSSESISTDKGQLRIHIENTKNPKT
jgi:hypothetical protein